MTACIAQHTSTPLPPINLPRKFHRSCTYDSQASASARKRLLSEQGDCLIYSLEYPEDDDGIKKRTRTGNCVILLPRKRMRGR